MELGTLIAQGKNAKLTYNLEGVGVLTFRPLTEWEYDEISIRYLGYLSTQNLLKSKEERTEAIKNLKGDAFVEYQTKIREEKYWIVLYAIKDFYSDISKDETSLAIVKKLSGITKFVDEINKVSGRYQDVAEDLKSFREDQEDSERNESNLETEEGAQTVLDSGISTQ